MRRAGGWLDMHRGHSSSACQCPSESHLEERQQEKMREERKKNKGQKENGSLRCDKAERNWKRMRRKMRTWKERKWIRS